MTFKPYLAAAAVVSLMGCNNGVVPSVARLNEPELISSHSATPPPGMDQDGCFGQDASPAVIETVTEQIMLQPAQIDSTGKVLYPAVYKTETHQAIIKERRELWFETPCSPTLTPEFVASLQRALAARGYYRGPISGEMSKRTRRAIRAFQQPQGLDSSILSKAAARQLGLVAYHELPEGYERLDVN